MELCGRCSMFASELLRDEDLEGVDVFSRLLNEGLAKLALLGGVW